MSQAEDRDTIIGRLRAPSAKPKEKQTATALVRIHYEEIRLAWMKERHGGKTWAEIGYDLRPSCPVAAGTVSRAYSRVSAERDKSPKGSRTKKTEVAATTSAPCLAPAVPSSRPNPFAKAIDPVRVNTAEGDHTNA